jgi:hypothetical protein
LFELYHVLLPQYKLNFNIKYVLDKTSSKNHQNLNLSVKMIAKCIITHIFLTEIF